MDFPFEEEAYDYDRLPIILGKPRADSWEVARFMSDLHGLPANKCKYWIDTVAAALVDVMGSLKPGETLYLGQTLGYFEARLMKRGYWIEGTSLDGKKHRNYLKDYVRVLYYPGSAIMNSIHLTPYYTKAEGT